jgi:hypothetical protein
VKLSIRGVGILSLLLLSLLYQVSARSADWLPVTPEELKMTQEPKAPGAAAIYLYMQVDRDDTDSSFYHYARLKVLTEEGRKYADVEIPFVKGSESVSGIEARTIRPDGSIVRFDGTVYDKPVASTRSRKLLAKTFTMPDVQPGSIIEYRYRFHEPYGFVYDSHWILSQNLFIRYGKYSLIPSPYFTLQWSWPKGLPDGSTVPTKVHGRIQLETHDVPAFVTEQLMPPEDELKYRVDFIYLQDAPQTDPDKFWKIYGKDAFKRLKKFIDEPKAMQRAVAQIVQPSDPPEAKLRKIYARVAEMHNTDYDRQKTEEEAKRDNQKPAKNVEQVWDRREGTGTDLTYLFVALARAAGFDADMALVSTRNRYFFQRRMMNPQQLNSNLVIVNLDGKNLYLDPGVPFTPFGLLPWFETAVTALRLKDDGGNWLTIPNTPPEASRIERKADLKLTANGSLDGKLTIRYTGLEAAWRRTLERNEDATDRKQTLEDEIKGSVPTGLEVTLTNTPDWSSIEEPLVVECTLHIPGWAMGAGHRQLVRAGVFANEDDHTFEHGTRVQPMYFDFPYQHSDDVAIELPAGTKVASTPKPQKVAAPNSLYSFDLSTEVTGNIIHVKRDISINMLLVDAKYYPLLRDFYQSVRAGDEEQIVVSAEKSVAQR